MSKSITSKRVTEFTKLVTQGMECWVKAGEIYVKAIEDDPDFPEKVMDANPEITPSILRKFEMLGRKQLHPKLLMIDGAGIRKLRAMPYSVQCKHLEEPIEMLVVRDGDTDTLKVDVREISTEAAKQVFGTDHIRSLPEQRSYIEASRALKDTSTEYETPWQVRRGKVHFDRGCILTRQEMASILATMA